MKIFYFSLVTCFVIFFGCKNKEVEVKKQEPVVSDSLQKIISIDTVKREPIEDELSLSGEVDFNDNQVIKIFPNASGRVETVLVSLGDKVKKGQTLAIIKSADIVGDYADLASVKNDAAMAEKELNNEEHLYQSGISSEKDYIRSKIEYQKAFDAVRKAQVQIAINGGGKTKAGGTYVISSPVDGYVVEKNIAAGSFIRNDNSQNLFTVSNMQNVWVWANVFETDIQKIKEGEPAIVTTLAYPGKVFYGHVDQVNSVLDPASKAMKIKIVLPNPGMLLKPEMFTTITLDEKEDQKALSIPTNALIADNGKNFVVVYKDRNHVSVRQVTPLKVDPSITYIQSGLAEGELVISKNQILLFNSLMEE